MTGACHSSQTNWDPVSYPVPFGHVPYTTALPDAMAPLLDFPKDWWYYGGWAHDLSKTKQFTILVQAIRITWHQETYGAILYGIGTPSDGKFSAQWSAGPGYSDHPEPGKQFGLVIPPPTSKSWSLEAHTTQPSTINMTCVLVSGILGLSGATYKLDMTDETNGVSAQFVLKDTFGMVLEGASGAYGKDSYEFAMPSLSILKGAITLDGVTTQLGGGNLWLDRQSVNRTIPDEPSLCGQDTSQRMEAMLAAHTSKPLYTGDWLAVVMNDKTVYSFFFFWPVKKDQWIVGSELDHPVNPTSKTGLEYPSLSNWDLRSPIQGVIVLDSCEFDLNILDPGNPSESPHWTSQVSKHTYCSAWKLKIRDKVYTMTAFVPGSEVAFRKSYFYEGAATISDDCGCQVGYAFVEQMGFTQ